MNRPSGLNTDVSHQSPLYLLKRKNQVTFEVHIESYISSIEFQFYKNLLKVD